MLMCTDPGDLVLDPTCGSGTTAYVAEQWGRRWITIDTSRVALALARQRIMARAVSRGTCLPTRAEGYKKEQSLTAHVLPRQRSVGDIRQGFVYDRVPHITLEVDREQSGHQGGMTRSEIDAAIKRHADFELLYDKPFEDTKKVRVAGPFTVESLSPHRALSFKDWAGADVGDRGCQGCRRAELRAVDPRQPRQGRHPERHQGGADQVRGVRDLRRLVHPGHRRAGRRLAITPSRPGSASRSARSTER